MRNVDKLAELLNADVTTVTFRGRKYAVTRGTGERNFGSEGGGSAAFAYAVSDLRARDLVAGDFGDEVWDYSTWCNTMSVVEDRGLARKLAREYGWRLTQGGSCNPVLSDAEFARLTK